MLATGNSQLVFLAELVQHAPTSTGSASRAFHMDEYVGLPPTHTASFQRYMRERVAAQLPVKEFHYLDGDTGDAAGRSRTATRSCCAPTRSTCAAAGIGENGHLAFNDPPVADFDDPRDVKIVALEPASRRQQVGGGPLRDASTTCRRTRSPSRFPRCSGAGACSRSCPRRARRAGARRALGPITTACPASILRRQPARPRSISTRSRRAGARRRAIEGGVGVVGTGFGRRVVAPVYAATDGCEVVDVVSPATMPRCAGSSRGPTSTS